MEDEKDDEDVEVPEEGEKTLMHTVTRMASSGIDELKASMKFHPELFQRTVKEFGDEENLAKKIELPKDYHGDEIERTGVELAVNSLVREKKKVNLIRGFLKQVQTTAAEQEKIS